MNTMRTLLASALTLIAGCLLQAADSKPIARVIAVQEIETDDPSGYASWVAKSNEATKAKLGIDTYIHVYVSGYDGVRSGSVRSMTIADSVAALARNAAAMENDPALLENREHLRGIRKLGSRTLYQAVRYDGANKNGSTLTTLAMVTDEPGYLKALDQLRALMDQKGMKDAKINAYRVMAGRTTHTHRVTINIPSQERLAAMLDWLGTDPQMAEWLAASSKFRTVVSNGTAREITK